MSTNSSVPGLERRAQWLLAAMHVPFMGFVIGQGGFGLGLPRPEHASWLGVPLSIAASALQLRHSLAVAAGVRPRYWQWTVVALVALAYVPLPVFGSRWVTLQWFVLASFAMLLSSRAALVAIIGTTVGVGVWYAAGDTPPDAGVGLWTWTLCYWMVLDLLGGGGLYGATRLVHLMRELRSARAGLAELAMDRERLRIARDLHDLLGQSLSAVSLKGDLAMGLLERGDVEKAATEIESLVSVARSALHDVLDVAHREPPIAFSSEIDRATELLASTGTETRVDIQVEELAPAVDELFAWALREGVTNVLRHSAATACTISIRQQNDVVRFEILNDGAMPPSPGGSGLSGIASRAAALSGDAIGRSLGDGRFRLRVEVPVLAEMLT